jgi:Lrp/AsnC family leucine-responsive transcriptional regulator
MPVETSADIDQIDWKLIEALQTDGRASFAELGRQVSLSPPAVAERVRRLELAGVITGYRATVDPARLGLDMQAWIRIVVSGPEYELVGSRLKEVPEVVECHRVTGTDSYVVKAVVRSVAHLEDLTGRIMPHAGSTITSIVLSTPVPFKPITRQLAEGLA